MDVLIKQLSRMIENRDSVDEKTASMKALREIILSGLSRSGFMKECTYLSKMDLYEKDCIYLSFLNQGGGFLWNDHLRAIQCEMNAAGIIGEVKEEQQGFTIDHEGIKLGVFVYEKDFGLNRQLSYQQQPVPYEMRTIVSMSEGIRAEIEKALDEYIHPYLYAKEYPEKSKTHGNKKKKKKDDSFLQPSLFDF